MNYEVGQMRDVLEINITGGRGGLESSCDSGTEERPMEVVSVPGLCLVLMVVVQPLTTLAQEAGVGENTTYSGSEDKMEQVVWKKCYHHLTPACLKLTVLQLVDRLAEDTPEFHPWPGVVLSTNHSSSGVPLKSSRMGALPPQERLDAMLTDRVKRYLKSFTLSVRLLDTPSANSTDLVDAVVDGFTGRRKGGAGLGAAGAGMMLGGAMMTMLMAGLAAMAGKALMTSMMALMLAAMGSMKGGGGDGGHQRTTYEIIAKPEVSHAHTHSSEIQHAHGWRRRRNVDSQVAYRATAYSK